MAVTVSKYSSLNFTDLKLIDGYEFWDTADLPALPAQFDDLQHTVVATDRLDLLAKTYYGTPTLKWVIAAANELEIEPTELVPGDILRIPSPRYVLQQLFVPTNRKI